jgi:hypothetical protein
LGHWIHASRGKIWSDFLLPISSGTVLPTLLELFNGGAGRRRESFVFLAFVIDLDKT